MRVTREQRIFGCSFINVDLQNRSCTDNGCISFILVPHISTGYRTHLSDMVLWYCASWVHCESMTVIQWVFFCVSCRGLGDILYGPYVGPLVSRPRAVVLPFSPEGGACHVYVRSCVRFRNYCLGRAACTRACGVRVGSAARAAIRASVFRVCACWGAIWARRGQGRGRCGRVAHCYRLKLFTAFS